MRRDTAIVFDYEKDDNINRFYDLHPTWISWVSKSLFRTVGFRGELIKKTYNAIHIAKGGLL